MRFPLPLALIVLLAGLAAAHPVPSSSYDRVIRVTLSRDLVQVEYKLEINPLTVYLQIAGLLSAEEQAALKGGTDRQFYDAFATAIAPVIADRLEAWEGGQPLTFHCENKSWSSEHNIVCTFVFAAKWPGSSPGPRRFRIEENNFRNLRGAVDLAFAEKQGGELENVEQASAELKSRAAVERTTEDAARLRRLSAVFKPNQESDSAPKISVEPPPPAPTFWQRVKQRGLVALLDLPGGLLVVLLGSIVFGAVHALQPGHGKTLVAAYLVGERGTVTHALTLGLVTTITHTGVVLIISVILWLAGDVSRERIQTLLSFVSGILVAGLGIWLLLRRLAGQADHFHLFGGKHHHHGPDGHHHHLPPPSNGVRFWNLILLGIGGGIVPCWDAIVLQIYVTAKGELWLGPPIILAFSAGLAATLVAIGILVVKLKGFGASRWGKGRFVKALPVISAVLITLLGAWLILDAAAH